MRGVHPWMSMCSDCHLVWYPLVLGSRPGRVTSLSLCYRVSLWYCFADVKSIHEGWQMMSICSNPSTNSLYQDLGGILCMRVRDEEVIFMLTLCWIDGLARMSKCSVLERLS